MKARTIFVALALASCSRSHGPAPAPSAQPQVSAAPVSADAGRAEELVDLLYQTRAKISVSSNVSNPKDYPEHLIDRRPETAWNGKTGDLDAHIDFEVPASARIKRLLITPGYDKVTKEGDLFTMNLRVAEVALERDGQRLGTFTLDTESRKPQAIDVDLPGGKLTLRVTKTAPGTQTKWRELVISELVILGTAPQDELLAPAMPVVSIGDQERTRAPREPYAKLRAAAPFPTLEGYCAKEIALTERELAAMMAKNPNNFLAGELHPYCRGEALKIKERSLGGAFLDVRYTTAQEGDLAIHRVALKTTAGWFPTDVVLEAEDYGPGCGLWSGYAIDSATTRGDSVLVLRIGKRASYCMAGGGHDYNDAASFLVACAVDPSGRPTCKEELIASTSGDCSEIYRARSGEGTIAVRPSKWDWQREAVVESDGAIRLLPCVTEEGAQIACNRRNADLLRR